LNKIKRHLWAKYRVFKYIKEFDPKIEFRNKNIAVIGAADSALKFANESVIENADFVIRINKAPHAWQPEMQHFIGKKTDVLFHSFYENPSSGGGEIDYELYKKFGIQKIVNPNNNSSGRKAHLNFYKRHKIPFQTYLLEKNISEEIYNYINGYIPTIGFYALSCALLAETNSVFVTGFSFFKTPYYKGYRNNLQDPDINDKHIQKQGLHNPELEFLAFQKILKSSPSKSIILDEELEKLVASKK